MLLIGVTEVEHQPITLTVRGATIARIRTSARRYACPAFGDIGPLPLDLRPAIPIGADGRFHAVTGPVSERTTVSGRRTHRDGRTTITGTLRVAGTIGTGDPCASRTLRFAVRS